MKVRKPQVFGTVSHLGVRRQYDKSTLSRVLLVCGLPGYPKELLKGDEDPQELKKGWMVSVINKATGAVIETKFFGPEADATAQVRKALKQYCNLPDAQVNKLKDTFHLKNWKPGDTILKHIRSHIQMDEP